MYVYKGVCQAKTYKSVLSIYRTKTDHYIKDEGYPAERV